jgi:glycosyltransferase involved in cell wall biosynthesis
VVEEAGGGIFVQPGSDEAIANAVKRLACDRELCRVMGRHARSYVTEHFDRQQQAEQFTELIEKVGALQ